MKQTQGQSCSTHQHLMRRTRISLTSHLSLRYGAISAPKPHFLDKWVRARFGYFWKSMAIAPINIGIRQQCLWQSCYTVSTTLLTYTTLPPQLIFRVSATITILGFVTLICVFYRRQGFEDCSLIIWWIHSNSSDSSSTRLYLTWKSRISLTSHLPLSYDAISAPKSQKPQKPQNE